MEKRHFNIALFVVFMLILSYFVIAAHTASIFVGPDSVYETNKAGFYLFVGNNPGSNAIVNVSLSHPGYGSIEVLDLSPWLYDGDINWYNGLISQFGSQTFVFNATAQLVDANTTFSWDVTTADNNGGVQVNTVNVVVLNDQNPPSILNIYPEDYSFVRNDTIYFTIFVQELETSIPGGFNLGFDDNNPMQTSGAVKDNIVMTNSGGNVFTGSLDPNNSSKVVLSSGSKYLDYRITGLSDAAGNNYDEGSNFPHHIYIDIEYPNVVLNQPDSLLTNQYLHNITFNMSENSFEANGQGSFNADVNCTVFVDSISYGPQTYTNNVNYASILANITDLSDGIYPFYMQCSDRAGYVANSEVRAITLDTTGPVISLVAPPNNSVMLNGTQIALSVTDSPAGVDSVWYNNGTNDIIVTSTIDTSNWNEGMNNITVYANDTLNNINSLGLSFTIDKTAPVITLLDPLNGSIANSGVDFAFNVTDNYDSILTCNLFMDGNDIYTIGGNSGQITTISDDLGLSNGDHEWFVRCMDDVTLTSDSEKRNISVDAIAPQIDNLTLFIDLLNDTNYPTGFVNFSLNINDLNGISACEVYVNNSLVLANSTPDFSFSLSLASNYGYSVAVGCNDTVNNWLQLPELTLYYDNIAPVIDINNIAESVTDTSATVTWSTDELADSNLSYWDGADKNVNDTGYVLGHSISITGLTSSTIYYYNISSNDRWNNTGFVLNLSFTTSSTVSPGPSGPSGPSGGPGGGPSDSDTGGAADNLTTVNATTIGIEKETVEINETNITVEPVNIEPPGITGAAVMNSLKSSIPMAIIAGIIATIVLVGLYRIVNSGSRKPKHVHINEKYRNYDTDYKEEAVKDEDIFDED